MIYLCTAFYDEAEPFIHYLHLKKDLNVHTFQLFVGDGWRLIVMGTGKIKAAIAVTYLLNRMPPSQEDFLINIGICGTAFRDIQIGEAFLVNQLIEAETGRTYYPDLLFSHDFKEASLVTVDKVIQEDEGKNEWLGQLIDMEAAGFYEAAITFMQTHQIGTIKLVSDHLQGEAITREQVKRIISLNVPKITAWLRRLEQCVVSEENVLSAQERAMLSRIAEQLQCSETMKHELIQFFQYKKCLGQDIEAQMLQLDDSHCSSKREGKKILEAIRREII